MSASPYVVVNTFPALDRIEALLDMTLALLTECIATEQGAP